MHKINWTLWTEWVAFDTLDWAAVPQAPGAYIIAASQPIHRAVGTDSNGYLDVGESENLCKRLRSFHHCITIRGRTGHMAGWRFAFFHFERQFPHAALRVKWREARTKEEAYAAEGEVLLEYVRRHCELPPLNYKFNWQVFETHGWDILDQEQPAIVP
jgi:hypothetical protein